MSGLLDYLNMLVTRQAALKSTVFELESAIDRLDQLERLNVVVRRIHSWQSKVLIDPEAPTPIRRANAWAAVGPGGIPDDVTVVGETASLLFGEFGEVQHPDIQTYIDQGMVVIAGSRFLEIARLLREEVTAGRPVLPYHPG